MIKDVVGIIVVGILILGAIIYGFSSSGSPAQVRSIKFDSQRLSDINNLKYRIEAYYSVNQKLPVTLEEADAEYRYSGSIMPVDPETKKDYEYIPGVGLEYKLCATFSRSNIEETQRQSNNYAIYGSNLEHPKGYFCFDMTISPKPTRVTDLQHLTPTPTIILYSTPMPKPTGVPL